MFVSILAGVLLGLGAVALGYLVVKVAAITMTWLKNKIRERMEKRHGGVYVVSQRKVKEKMKEAMEQEMKENGVAEMDLEEFDEMLGSDGVILADADDGDNIDVDTI